MNFYSDDQARWYAKECSNLNDEQLLKVLGCDLDLSTLPPNSTSRYIDQRLGPTPRPFRLGEMPALESALRRFRHGPLDVKAQVLKDVSCTGQEPTEPCVPCSVVKNPDVACPGTFVVGEEFTIHGSVYGGDFGSLGEPGCASVRHEVRITGPGEPNSSAGIVLSSWDEEVLEQSAFVAYPLTITAQHMSDLGDPAEVLVWVRSYTCEDNDFTEDFCVTFPSAPV